jgi:TIR domain
LEYFIRATHLEPYHAIFVHGLAYAYYQIEKNKADHKHSLNQENLVKSNEYFEQSLLLDKTNCRLYHDFGLLKILVGQNDEALFLFNQGLIINPHHYLLLLERGLLLHQLGRHAEAMEDLRLGQILTRNNPLMHEKYSQTLQDRSSKDTHLQKILIKCFEYAVLHKKIDKGPTLFISYAWGNHEHEQWVEQFAEDLEKAGFHILLDRWIVRKGQELNGFIEKILSDETDYIIVVGTKLYMQKYNAIKTSKEHVIKLEGRLLNFLIGFNLTLSDKVIPILLEGTATESLPPMMQMKYVTDFTLQKDYGIQLLELIRDLYRIDPRDSYFKKLKNDLIT